MTVTNALRNKLPGIQARMKYLRASEEEEVKEPDSQIPQVKQEPETVVNQIPIAQLERRLELIKNWR
jgi:ATP-dependent Clp protease protease subunit